MGIFTIFAPKPQCEYDTAYWREEEEDRKDAYQSDSLFCVLTDVVSAVFPALIS